jgi:hypothetical protein
LEFGKLASGKDFMLIQDDFYLLSEEGLEYFKAPCFGQAKLALDTLGVIWIKPLGKVGDSYGLISFDPLKYVSWDVTYEYFTDENLKYLDINQVNALYMSWGDMFYDVQNQNASYEVPKGSGLHANYAAMLNIVGLDANGNYYGGTGMYRSSGHSYLPGPLRISENAKGTITNQEAVKYDKIWKLSRKEIENFKHHFNAGDIGASEYEVPIDILTWPAHGEEGYAVNLAPFVDVDNNGKYEPGKGDYPKIKGDMMLYWIVNDVLAKRYNENLPAGIGEQKCMGVEVHISAYAYLYDDAPNDSLDAINYTTFLNYMLINRSVRDYEKVRYGLYSDCDLGFNRDDYIGTHVGLNTMYFYNADNIDGEGGYKIYGENPPAVGYVLLPQAGKGCNSISSVMSFNSNTEDKGYPEYNEEYYNYLSSKWKNGQPLMYGGDGYNKNTTEVEAKYMFPGTSDTEFIGTGGTEMPEWSEITAENIGGDRRGIAGVGPIDLASGEEVEMDIAIVWSRGNDGAQSSVDKLFYDVANVRDWFKSGNIPSNYNFTVNVKETGAKESNLALFPNPAKSTLQYSLKASAKEVTVNVYDTKSQLVLSEKGNAKGQLDVSALDAGVYILKITGEGVREQKVFVKEN